MKILLLEIRRLITKASTLIMAMLLPVILVSAISLSLLPMLFGKAGINEINVSVYYEDDSPEIILIGKALTEHESSENFMNVIRVYSKQEGLRLVNERIVSAFVYVPAGFKDTIYNGDKAEMFYYFGDRDKELSFLIYKIFNDGVNLINYAQQSVDTLYDSMNILNYSPKDSVSEYNDTSVLIFTSILSKVKTYSDNIKLSPISDYLPIEYYSISTLILALFFGATPILIMFSKDINNGTLARGSLMAKRAPYLIIKILSGAILIIIQMAFIIPIILLQNGAFGLFSGNILLIFACVILCGFYFSTIMLMIGSISKDSSASLWLGFTIIVLVSFISGLIIPSSVLPEWVNSIAQYTGLPSIFKMFSSSLFGISAEVTIMNFIICISVTLFSFSSMYFILKWRRL